MKKLLALALALVMVMALGMTALADGEIVSVMYGGGTPESMDPALNSASAGSNLIRLAFSGLMGTRVTDGVVTKEPELAESYTVSEDGTVYTFTLREGLKWSDGSDLLASDFVKSWNRAANPDLGASYGFLFDVIDGYGTDSLNVVADDAARTLTVTLKAPCAYFLELCGFTTYYPVKTDLADSEGAWAVNPATFIGTGPFRMVEYKVDDVIVYEKNPNYWNAENVKLGGVNAYLSEDSVAILAAYEAGTVSFIQTMDPAEFDRLNATYPGELQMAEQIGTYYILFNVHKDLSPEGKAFTQAEQSKVRYALGLMVNRQDLVDYVTMGGQVPATGFYPVGLGDGNTQVERGEGKLYSEWYTGTATYSDEYPAYTVDQVEGAKILMDMGYTTTGSLETGDLKFTDVPGFEFAFNQNATNSAIVQYVQECWNLFGINATINTEAWATLQTKLKEGDAEASRMGWVADFNDCVNFLEIFISNSGNNYPRLGQDLGTYTRNTENTKDAGLAAVWGENNDKTWAECYDALVTAVKNETDPAKRAQMCAEAENILMATGSVAPLYYYTNPIMVKPNVKNLAVLPTGDIVWNYAYLE